MAFTPITGKNGLWSTPLAGYVFLMQSFAIKQTQPTTQITYFDSTLNCSSNIGSGTLDYTISGTGFGKKGDGNPGLVYTTSIDTGATTTFQFDTGVTLQMTALIDSIGLSESAIAAGLPVDFSGKNGIASTPADPVATWT